MFPKILETPQSHKTTRGADKAASETKSLANGPNSTPFRKEVPVGWLCRRYYSWIAKYFPGDNSPKTIGLAADPCRTGTPNVTAFLTAVSPLVFERGSQPTLKVDQQKIQATFRRSERASIFQPFFEVSMDMMNWEPLDEEAAGISLAIGENEFGFDEDGFGVDRITVEIDTSIYPACIIRQVIPPFEEEKFLEVLQVISAA